MSDTALTPMQIVRRLAQLVEGLENGNSSAETLAALLAREAQRTVAQVSEVTQ